MLENSVQLHILMRRLLSPGDEGLNQESAGFIHKIRKVFFKLKRANSDSSIKCIGLHQFYPRSYTIMRNFPEIFRGGSL